MFLGEEADEDATLRTRRFKPCPAPSAKGTVLDMFTWVRNKGYDGDEQFQRYHARMIQERNNGDGG